MEDLVLINRSNEFGRGSRVREIAQRVRNSIKIKGRDVTEQNRIDDDRPQKDRSTRLLFERCQNLFTNESHQVRPTFVSHHARTLF
jgi:hypothetical protein